MGFAIFVMAKMRCDVAALRILLFSLVACVAAERGESDGESKIRIMSPAQGQAVSEGGDLIVKFAVSTQEVDVNSKFFFHIEPSPDRFQIPSSLHSAQY